MDKKIHEGFREEGTLELKLEGVGNRPLVSKAQCTIQSIGVQEENRISTSICNVLQFMFWIAHSK